MRLFPLLNEALNDTVDADFYLIDVTLPDGQGYEYAQYIRQFSDVPIIFLSVKDDQESLIGGFDSGADDYLTKPFTFEELDKRMHVLNKRYQAKVLKFGTLKIDIDRTKVTSDHQEIYLSVQEYRMLVHLVKNHNRIVKREELNQILNILESVQDNTLNVAMGRLRKKLNGIIEIETMIKEGYRIHKL